jgi:hypothetical protein
MLETEVQGQGHETKLNIRHIDDTAQIRQELWVRCEKMENKVGELVKELQAEREKQLKLLHDYMALQNKYESAQREIATLKRDLKLASYMKDE